MSLCSKVLNYRSIYKCCNCGNGDFLYFTCYKCNLYCYRCSYYLLDKIFYYNDVQCLDWYSVNRRHCLNWKNVFTDFENKIICGICYDAENFSFCKKLNNKYYCSFCNKYMEYIEYDSDFNCYFVYDDIKYISSNNFKEFQQLELFNEELKLLDEWRN